MADIGVEEALYKRTSTASLNVSAHTYITTFNREVSVSFIGIHIDADFEPGDIIEIYFDSFDGLNYDFLLAAEDMRGKSDFVWYPDFELFLKTGDELRVVVPQLLGATAYITSIARQA